MPNSINVYKGICLHIFPVHLQFCGKTPHRVSRQIKFKIKVMEIKVLPRNDRFNMTIKCKSTFLTFMILKLLNKIMKCRKHGYVLSFILFKMILFLKQNKLAITLAKVFRISF